MKLGLVAKQIRLWSNLHDLLCSLSSHFARTTAILGLHRFLTCMAFAPVHGCLRVVNQRIELATPSYQSYLQAVQLNLEARSSRSIPDCQSLPSGSMQYAKVLLAFTQRYSPSTYLHSPLRAWSPQAPSATHAPATDHSPQPIS